MKKDDDYVALPIKFQPFLSLWLKDHNVVLAAPTGWRFQPFLRFYPLRMFVIKYDDDWEFQPFLRFYVSEGLQPRSLRPGRISTLLEILPPASLVVVGF